jgi:hypothetical protein
MGIESLEAFKNLLGDIVRPNRFLVTVFPPSAMLSGMKISTLVNILDMSTVLFNVRNAQLPSKSFGEYPMRYMGQTYTLPGDLRYEDLVITFLMDDKWKSREFFESWNDLILNMSDNSRTDAKDLMDASIIIFQIGNRTAEVLASYRFESVFPKAVGSVELSQDAQDRYEEFTVTFSYSYWTRPWPVMGLSKLIPR